MNQSPLFKDSSTEVPLPVLGVDVSKHRLDIHLLREREARAQFPNTEIGCQQLLSWLVSQGAPKALIVMEATGWYHQLLCALAHQKEHQVAVINPRRILEFSRSKGRKNKTDKVDARLIAQYGATNQVDLWLPWDKDQEVLRDWVRRLDDLESMVRQEKNRLEAAKLKNATLQKGIKATIAALEKQQRAVQAAINALLKESPKLMHDVRRLQAIKGIGFKTAVLLAAEIPRHFSCARALCAWLGLTPRQYESGTSVRRRSRIGHEAPDLRRKLYWTAITAKNRDPRFHQFAKRLAAKGKAPLSVAFAVLHKIMRSVYALLSDPSKTYDPHHNHARQSCSP